MFRNVALTGILAFSVVLAGCGESSHQTASGAGEGTAALPVDANSESKTPAGAVANAISGTLAEVNVGFARLDTNGDNKISRDEYVDKAKERFNRFDKNKDHVVVAAEMPKSASPKTFPNMDKDKNGKVTSSEMVASYDATFAKLDKNKDRFLGPDEVPHSKSAP